MSRLAARLPIRQASCLGFTAIELVAVIVLVSILAVIALPKLTTPASITLASSASQLVGAIRYTQSLSMSQGQRYRLNLTSNSYQITEMGGGTASLPQGVGTSIALSPVTLSGYAATLTSGYISFNTSGAPFISATTALTSTATITLTSGSDTVSITISPETGAVR